MHNAFLTFQTIYEIPNVIIQMKASEQYFPVVLITVLYKVAQAFESMDSILKCDHSNESY